MTVFAPLIFWGWVPFSISMFQKFNERKAILITVIGGVLFLPQISFRMPLVVFYNKNIAIATALLVGYLLRPAQIKESIKSSNLDFFIIIWCSISPLLTSLANSLGLYNGLSDSVINTMQWGIYYWVGRKYFNTLNALKELIIGLIVGGLLYLPFILYELRMSPQLSNIFYGVFPHNWLQHVRYGGFRPIVFMQHGLMVSLWMAICSIASFWLWRSKEILQIREVKISIITIALAFTTILTKSSNGISFLVIGIISWYFFKKRSLKIFYILLLTFPAYIVARTLDLVSIETLSGYLSSIFNEQRIDSLLFRLNQENLFSQKILDRLVLGWGGFGRNRPIDPRTGEIIAIVDSLWLIIFSTKGLLGLTSFFGALLIGPILILRRIRKNFREKSVIPMILSLIVLIFAVDCLLNAMTNPIYMLCSGALVSYALNSDESFRSINESIATEIIS